MIFSSVIDPLEAFDRINYRTLLIFVSFFTFMDLDIDYCNWDLHVNYVPYKKNLVCLNISITTFSEDAAYN